MATTRERELRWLKKAEHWGEWIRFSETELAEPERVWMMRGASGRVRFFAEGQGQVGVEHASVVAASSWAWANRWLWLEPDGSLDMLGQLACRKWVLAGGSESMEPVAADDHTKRSVPSPRAVAAGSTKQVVA